MNKQKNMKEKKDYKENDMKYGIDERLRLEVDVLKDLYLSTFDRFLIQNTKHKNFKTGDKLGYRKGNGYLTDYQIAEHLKCNKTIAFFSKPFSTKVMILDIDTEDSAAEDTKYLINILVKYFQVESKYIYVTFSGYKGYHITLFFDNEIGMDFIKSFYEDILLVSGFNKKQVELRPLHTNACKLPLSIHNVTDEKCVFVDNITLEPILDEDYIFKIQKIDRAAFKKHIKSIKHIIVEEYKDFTDVRKATHSSTLSVEDKQYFERNYQTILDTKMLLHKSTRNNVTHLMSRYLKDVLNYSESECIDLLLEIVLNTKKHAPDLISINNIESLKKVTINTVKDTYKYNYKFSSTTRNNVYINLQEIKDILALKDFKCKVLYLCFLVQSKRYKDSDGNFFISYKQLQSMSNQKLNEKTISKYIKELVRLKYLKVVKRGGYYSINPLFSSTYKILKNNNKANRGILIEKNKFNNDSYDLQLDVIQLLVDAENEYKTLDLKEHLKISELRRVKNYIKERRIA
ncbi:TOTE conflict system archaeo-eukaryotic primase domain-containing protein [Macrococcus capreoli]|uniref:TOTE conflict system archaeo-eukaryotic primase domain-containing protein n=1 Tax=Macrococcus capreoli TaxID=2982690 RepID=UPI003F430EDD